jgi:hypothetical protein
MKLRWWSTVKKQKNIEKRIVPKKTHMYYYIYIRSLYITHVPVCTTMWQKEVSWKNHKKPCDALKHFQVCGYYSWHHNSNETSTSCVIIHRKAWDIGLPRFVPNSGTNRFFTGTCIRSSSFLWSLVLLISSWTSCGPVELALKWNVLDWVYHSATHGDKLYVSC